VSLSCAVLPYAGIPYRSHNGPIYRTRFLNDSESEQVGGLKYLYDLTQVTQTGRQPTFLKVEVDMYTGNYLYDFR
jgi:hypothetical protein